MIKKLLSTPPVVIDGTLYVTMALFGAVEGYFTGKEAYEYVNPYAIFWIKGFCIVLLAMCMALKTFRSTTYSEHQKAKKEAAEGDVTALKVQTETITQLKTTTDEKTPV